MGVGGAVGLVHAPAEFDAPLGEQQGEGDVGADGDQGDQGVPDVVEHPQDGADHQDLQQRRQNVEQHERKQELDAPGAALDGAAEAAGLAVEMKAQRQPVQLVEHVQGHGADRALGDLGEYEVAQLAERHRQHPRHGVTDDQAHRQHQRRRDAVAQHVHRLLVEDRHVDVDRLGGDQEADGDDHANPHLPRPRRPQIGQERADRADLEARGSGGVRIGAGQLHGGIDSGGNLGQGRAAGGAGGPGSANVGL